MTRGRLRIYLGAAPGVGKTVAMLAEAHRRRDRGTDVVVGWCETHGRRYTASMLEGLEAVPPRPSQYRGSSFTEMDTDAILARSPAVVLVDELAHTNVPGSDRARRWEDVDAILNAGIDVISTVNIQHLQSLHDVVESITGIHQRETVPDAMVRGAAQIELVDMSPEALRRRMAHGNIYGADTVDAALANYFRVGNLSALRELALLWLADRVDEGLERYRQDQGISASWPTRERVLVALTGGSEGETLLRRAGRIISRRAGSELVAVYVSRADGLVSRRLASITTQRTLTIELGGTFHVVTGDHVARAILDFAEGINASQIVIGASRRSLLRSLLRPGIGEAVIAGAGEIDVLTVSHDQARKARDPRRPAEPLGIRRLLAGWVMATLGLSLVTVLLALAHTSRSLPLDVLFFLSLTVGCALVGGIWPASFCAIAGSLTLNYYFIPPVDTFTISDPYNVAAVVVFVVIAAAVASVVHVSARRAAEAVAAQRESRILVELSHSLLGVTNPLPELLERTRDAFGMRRAAIVSRVSVREPWTIMASTNAIGDVATEESVGQASTLEPVDETRFLALWGPAPEAEQQRLIGAFASHAAAIINRDELQQQARSVRSLAKENRTGTALLAAVSHDLRTPLAGIKAAVTSLRQDEIQWSPEDEGILLETIEESADRLNVLIDNLLDMSRLQTGTVNPRLGVVHLRDAVMTTVDSLSEPRRIRLSFPVEPPPVLADAGLLDRVLANILENALRLSPGRTEVVVQAGDIGGRVQCRVVDRGVGVPEAAKSAIFAPFQRYGDAPHGEGLGLGLAVARGLTEAMNGTLEAEDTPGGGLTVIVELPMAPTSRAAATKSRQRRPTRPAGLP